MRGRLLRTGLPNGPSFLKRTLVIQQNTIQEHEAHSSCLTVEAANKFKDAISDLDLLESKSWLLQRKFDFAKPYILVDSSTIDRLFRRGPEGWIAFTKVTRSPVDISPCLQGGAPCQLLNGVLTGSRTLRLNRYSKNLAIAFRDIRKEVLMRPNGRLGKPSTTLLVVSTISLLLAPVSWAQSNYSSLYKFKGRERRE
jgi:hypothetical protein